MSSWLTSEMERRGWSNSELARRADVTHTSISRAINGSTPGLDVCTGIAHAFRMPPEQVLRLAGLLPPLPGGNVALPDVYHRLSTMGQNKVAEYTEFIYQREQEGRC